MGANNGDAHTQCGYQKRSHAGEEEDEDGGENEAGEDFEIGEDAAEEDDRLIGGAEDVEEEPGG